jgi:phage terminase small subunit
MTTHPLPPRPPAPPAQKAPPGLHAAAKQFWTKVLAEYLIDDPGSLLILTSACEAMSRMKQAQQLVDKEGMTTTDRFGQAKCHPAESSSGCPRLINI